MRRGALKSTTPLRGKGTGLRRTPFRRKPVALLPKRDREKPTAGKETGKKAKRRDKVDLVKRLDMVFSAYVRLRDAMFGGRTVCISCGRVLPFEQMQAGHYWSRRCMSTRWDADNVNAECMICNCNDTNHLKGYSINLLSKIGEERFERLSVLHNQERKWSDGELEDMIKHYTAEARRLSVEKCIKVNI